MQMHNLLEYSKSYKKTTGSLWNYCRDEPSNPLSSDSEAFNPIQDGGEAKRLPSTSFFPVTSTNVGIGPQNFLTFSFNPFDRLV